MFKFLFGTKPGAAPVKETTRQTAERALKELNEVLALLGEQPKVSIAPGMIDIDWPEQMPGEAKALPAPAPEEQAKPEDDAKPGADTVANSDAPDQDSDKDSGKDMVKAA